MKKFKIEKKTSRELKTKIIKYVELVAKKKKKKDKIGA